MTSQQVRTSTSHPLRIDPLLAADTGGQIGITFCPGKQGDSVRGARWERDLAADIDAIAHWGANAVVTLIEDHEFEMLGVKDLGAQVLAHGLEWHHLPIVDVQPPDERFKLKWMGVGPRLGATLQAGGKVLVHCRGGLGRAGTVAAQLLVELGIEPSVAIAKVRAARPGVIETRAQERYVQDLRGP